MYQVVYNLQITLNCALGRPLIVEGFHPVLGVKESLCTIFFGTPCRLSWKCWYQYEGILQKINIDKILWSMKSCLRENICILLFGPHLKALRVDKHTYIFFSKSSKMLICMMTEKYFFSLYPFFTFESKFQRGVSNFVIRRFHISLCLSSHSGTLPIKHSCHL